VSQEADTTQTPVTIIFISSCEKFIEGKAPKLEDTLRRIVREEIKKLA